MDCLDTPDVCLMTETEITTAIHQQQKHSAQVTKSINALVSELVRRNTNVRSLTR